MPFENIDSIVSVPFFCVVFECVYFDFFFMKLLSFIKKVTGKKIKVRNWTISHKDFKWTKLYLITK